MDSPGPLILFGNFVARRFGNFSKVRSQLDQEFDITARLDGKDEDKPGDKLRRCQSLYPSIHSRCSALLSHLSIMFGLAIYVFRQLGGSEAQTEGAPSWLLWLALADVALYAMLLMLSLRTLRSLWVSAAIVTRRGGGAEKEYVEAYLTETAYKFTLVDLINKFTAVGMLATLGLVAVHVLSAGGI